MPSVSSTDGSQASPKNLFSVQMQVHGAHGLRSADFHGTSDPYVAIRYKGLLLGKTTVKRKTLSPDWGSQTFVFGPVHQHRQLQVEVWDCDPLGFDECLGCVVLMVEKVSYNKKAFSLRSRPYKDDSGVSGTITLTYEMKSVSSQQQRSSSGSNKHIKVSAEGIFSQPSPFKRGVSVRSNSASSSSSSKLDLHGELASGNISVVIKNLTSENANVRNKQQETLLHKACSLGNEELFKALVEKKADLNLQDKDGWTPLHCAASKGFFFFTLLFPFFFFFSLSFPLFSSPVFFFLFFFFFLPLSSFLFFPLPSFSFFLTSPLLTFSPPFSPPSSLFLFLSSSCFSSLFSSYRSQSRPRCS